MSKFLPRFCKFSATIIFLNFIYLFLAVPGSSLLRGLFRSCGEQGLLVAAIRGLLIAVASLVMLKLL